MASIKITCPFCGAEALASPSKGLWCESCKNGTAYQSELENTVKCLMGYVMELHDFQIGARRIAYANEKYKDDDELKDFLIMKFPMLQGSRNHQTFRDLGKGSSWDDMGNVVKVLREKISCTSGSKVCD